jgi:RNA polymerase sigma-70 factor (ECF subfamily)
MSDEQTPKSPPISAKARTTEPSAKIADLIGYGNQLELADLWREHKTRLHGYIAKHMNERDAVDDVLQNVFLKANAYLHTVKSHGSITAWLFRIAENAITDYYRARKPWDELPDTLMAPEQEHNYAAELAVCLQPFIADLPEIYRTALVLSEIEGLPQREVANRLGISLSGAKSRVQRGKEKLRQRFLECCDIEIGRGGIIGYEPRVTRPPAGAAADAKACVFCVGTPSLGYGAIERHHL